MQVLLYDGIRRLTTRRVESRSDPVSPIRGFGLTGVPFFRVAPRGDLISELNRSEPVRGGLRQPAPLRDTGEMRHDRRSAP